MKKHHVAAAIGTLALVANLIVPGLAFGQAQTAQQTVNCPAGSLTLANTPDNMVFDAVDTSPTVAQNSYDADTSSNADLAIAHRLTVSDTRSGGVAGCPTSNPGFEVLTEITTTLTNGSTTIPDASFRAVTSNQFGGLAPDCTIVLGEYVCYGVAAGAGNAHDVTASVLYDDFNRDPDVVWDCFNSPNPYTDLANASDTDTTNECNPSGGPVTNTLDSNVSLVRTTTGHNMSVFTNVALYGLIPAGQAPGTYNGTITYTLNAV